MGLPVATVYSEDELPHASDTSIASSSDDMDCQIRETAVYAERLSSESASAEHVSAMNFSDSAMVDVAHDATGLIEFKPSADGNTSQVGVMIAGTADLMTSEEENVPTAASRVPTNERMVLMPCDTVGTVLESASDMSGAKFETALQVMQSLVEIVEVMDVVTNEAEALQQMDTDQELNPPAQDSMHRNSQPVSAENDLEAGIDIVLTEPTGKNDNVVAESCTKVKTPQKATKEKVAEVDQRVKMVGNHQEWSSDPCDDSLPVNTVDLCEVAKEGEEIEEQGALPISERRKHKKLEVFVGGLDKETTKEELVSVFGQVGDVVEVRLMKNAQTGKNKGYAFIRFASAAIAKRASHDLERVEIRGRSCGVLPSEENDTLFLGNISKLWKKEMVLETLKKFAIENVEDITLMEDPQLEGVNRGFAFIEFNTHKEALNAFRRLQQTDAIFGTDRSAKIAWAQPLNEPDEDTMSQVKSVFVDGMPPTWDEQKVNELFIKYGAVERIVLARNMLSAKRKDFGFVNYVERDAALLCIDALHNREIYDGDIKIKMKVMLAKPQMKSKAVKGGICGAYPQGFRGDHRIGVGIHGIRVPGVGIGVGMCLQGGVGLIPCDVLSSWGNLSHFENQIRLGSKNNHGLGIGNTQRLGKKMKRTNNTSNEEAEVKAELTHVKQSKKSTSTDKSEKKLNNVSFIQEGTSVSDNLFASSALENAEQALPHNGDVLPKSTMDKYECTMCGFGFDFCENYEAHMKTKAHKVIEGLHKQQKLHNKTPLSLLHEYASRNHCKVHYETEVNTNEPFEVTAVISALAGGSIVDAPIRGLGVGRNKARAKQMAASHALEKIMLKVPELEFTKPGQSRQRFIDSERPSRKTKTTTIGSHPGRGGGHRTSHRKLNKDWRSLQAAVSNPFPGLPSFMRGIGNGNSKHQRLNDLMFSRDNITNPNVIPLGRFNEFSQHKIGRGSFGPRPHGYVGGGGGGGFTTSIQSPYGVVPSQSTETFVDPFEQVQGGGGGFRSIGFGGREFMGSGGAIGNRSLGLVGANQEFETSGLKRTFISIDGEARFTDVQKALPWQHLELPEQGSIYSNTSSPGFGVQPLFNDTPSAIRASTMPSPPEPPQFGGYTAMSASQGVPGNSTIHQVPPHPTSMVGVPGLSATSSGTPFSMYKSASSPHPAPPPPPPPPGYPTMNLDYLANTAKLSEMLQGSVYPTPPPSSSSSLVYGPPPPFAPHHPLSVVPMVGGGRVVVIGGGGGGGSYGSLTHPLHHQQQQQHPLPHLY